MLYYNKQIDNDTAHTINYLMCNVLGDDYRLLGLQKVGGKIGHIGVEIEGDKFYSFYISKKKKRNLESDDHKEQFDIDAGSLYVAVIHGVDNCSYIKRFSSIEMAVKWYEKCECLSSQIGLLFYNS